MHEFQPWDSAIFPVFGRHRIWVGMTCLHVTHGFTWKVTGRETAGQDKPVNSK